MMDIMNKEKYGFVNPKTELMRFKWIIYKYYKLYVEEKEWGNSPLHYSQSLYAIQYKNYTDYLDRNVSRFRFLRETKGVLVDFYARRINKYYETVYHPENVDALTMKGHSFHVAINMIDANVEKQKEFF